MSLVSFHFGAEESVSLSMFSTDQKSVSEGKKNLRDIIQSFIKFFNLKQGHLVENLL